MILAMPVKVTVQMTLDADLVRAVDAAVRSLRTSRSAFAREAMRRELRRLKVAALDRKHREGYARHPVKAGEFGG